MRKKLVWGDASYQIISKDKVVLENHHAACYSQFMGGGAKVYDTIKLLDIDCEETIKYKDFYLQYVIDMLQLEEATFGEDFFQFKTLGKKYKDAAVMSIVRLIFEQAGNIQGCDTPNLLFKPLMENAECPYEDKLQRFCYFYKDIAPGQKYFSCGHSWVPKDTRIRTTKEFVEQEQWPNVNNFFSKFD